MNLLVPAVPVLGVQQRAFLLGLHRVSLQIQLRFL